MRLSAAAVLKLALPVVITYLGIMLMGTEDLIFVGRLNAESIGAVGVGTSFFSWIMIFGLGLLAGLDYLVSFAKGASRPEDGHRALVQSLIASTALSVPLTLILLLLSTSLESFGVQPPVARLAAPYLRIVATSLWPLLAFSACRQYLTALGMAVPGMVALIAGNLINIALNWLLIFGYRPGGAGTAAWAIPALGVDGSAWSTLIGRYAMAVGMFAYTLHWDRRTHGFARQVPWRVERERMREFLKLGLPSAFQMLLEVGVFALSTMLASRLAARELAAHLIVLNIASITFMVPLGLSSATAVLVGQALGRGDPREASRMGWRGLSYGAGFMTCSGVTLYLANAWILPLFTTDPSVSSTAARIILIAALFQLSDGIQVVATGALRGLGDTRSALVANLGGHWLVGLPTGVALCFYRAWGLSGLWTGLATGLTCVAASLLAVWRIRTREKARVIEI
jgi:MATE family multidrug resistance protein